MDNPTSKKASGFPAVITDLPEADMRFHGVKAWILQGENHQLIFFEMQPTARVPEHSHSYPQWGMVLDGTMKLTINSKTKTIRRGDDYLIPAQARHHAEFLAKTRVIDLFSEKTRYKPKTANNRTHASPRGLSPQKAERGFRFSKEQRLRKILLFSTAIKSQERQTRW